MTNRDVQQPMIVIQQASGWSKWASWLGWVGLFFCLPIIMGMTARYQEYFSTAQGIQEQYHSRSKTAGDKVAIIRAEGVLAQQDGFVKKQIDRVRQDDRVKAIVLRVDSPGGTVSASDYLYHHLCRLRDTKEVPIVVSMGSMAASGGYYIAMVSGDQENVIFAEPTTTTGSIGVIIPHYNISGLMEKWDIKNDSIVSHPRKELLSMTKPPSEEDRAILQRYVDQSFARFQEIVKAGRPLFREDTAELKKLATGEIFSAEQALQDGLVDKIGFVEDAVDRAIELAGLDAKNTRVVEYKQPLSVLQAIGVASTQAQPSIAAELAQLAVPRAYYLCTSLPGIGPAADVHRRP